MVDAFHKQIVDKALSGSKVEVDVKMTIGEMMLFHVLMQDYGLDLVGSDRFIPLMERNAIRIKSYDPPKGN